MGLRVRVRRRPLTAQVIAKSVVAAPDSGAGYIDYGRPNLKIRSGSIQEEWRARLLGRLKFKVFREMADSNITAGGFIQTLARFIGPVPWTTRPRVEGEFARPHTFVDGRCTYCRFREDLTDEDTCHASVATRIQGASEDMEDTVADMDSEIVRGGATYGCAPMEVTYKTCRGDIDDPAFQSDFDDGFVGWRSWSIRPLDSLSPSGGWVRDLQTDEFVEMVQLVQEDYSTRRIPMWKLLLFRFLGDKSNPEGTSLLSIAERSYYFGKTAEEIEMVGAKRALAGLPWMQVPLDVLTNPNKADQLASAWDLVTLVEQDAIGGIVTACELDTKGLPTGWKFQPVPSSGAPPFDLDTIIKRRQFEMCAGLGAGFLMIGQNSGDSSMDASKTSTFKLSILSILSSMRQVKNIASDELCRRNGWTKDLWPTREHGQIDRVAFAEFATSISSLLSAGGITYDDDLEATIRERGELPARATEADVPMPTDGVELDDDGAPVTKEDEITESPLPANHIPIKSVQTTLGIGKTRVLNLVAAGELKAARIAGLWRFDPKSVHDYLASAQHDPTVVTKLAANAVTVCVPIPAPLSGEWPTNRGGGDTSAPHITSMYMPDVLPAQRTPLAVAIARAVAMTPPMNLAMAPGVDTIESAKGEVVHIKRFADESVLRAFHAALLSAVAPLGLEVSKFSGDAYSPHSTLAYDVEPETVPEGAFTASCVEIHGIGPDITIPFGGQ